jgi:hypothetical protein
MAIMDGRRDDPSVCRKHFGDKPFYAFFGKLALRVNAAGLEVPRESGAGLFWRASFELPRERPEPKRLMGERILLDGDRQRESAV